MKAMILAAGLGTRLKPLTDTIPKALVKVQGKALIDYVIQKIRDSGIDDITVNVHHFAGQIISHLEGTGIHVSDESDLLRDTGGGIRHAARFLEGDEPFLVHNVDILSNIDLKKLISSPRPDAFATLVVSKRESSRYLLFDDNLRLVGWTNIRTGEVRSPFPALKPEECTALAFAGIHLMSPNLLVEMKNGELPEKFSIIDFYLSCAARYPVFGYVPDNFRMLDVGKISSLDIASDFVTAAGL